MSEELWLNALRCGFEETFFDGNQKAFLIGRASQKPSAA
jgi:hypothetical protein